MTAVSGSRHSESYIFLVRRATHDIFSVCLTLWIKTEKIGGRPFCEAISPSTISLVSVLAAEELAGVGVVVVVEGRFTLSCGAISFEVRKHIAFRFHYICGELFPDEEIQKFGYKLRDA
ncbi:hypothetical protein VNO80_21976 [Phaseolus coccineus]|uniref:Uncharacterized protein n=1 Tax=Phaseolus coccineus TaxID=3886 RepID=A0AAN9M409_PHACN